MGKIKDFDTAQLFVKGWAKRWQIRIYAMEVEMDRYLFVELGMHEAFSLKMANDLQNVFSSVMVVHRCQKLGLAIYLW